MSVPGMTIPGIPLGPPGKPSQELCAGYPGGVHRPPRRISSRAPKCALLARLGLPAPDRQLLMRRSAEAVTSLACSSLRLTFAVRNNHGY